MNLSDLQATLVTYLARMGSASSRELDELATKHGYQSGCLEAMTQLRQWGYVEVDADFRHILVENPLKLVVEPGLTHHAGELIALSCGEYSDYRFNGLYRALKDLDLTSLVIEYYDSCGPIWEDRERTQDNVEASDTGFGAWLISHGWVEELDYDEIHCGSYSFDLKGIVEHLKNRKKDF